MSVEYLVPKAHDCDSNLCGILSSDLLLFTPYELIDQPFPMRFIYLLFTKKKEFIYRLLVVVLQVPTRFFY